MNLTKTHQKLIRSLVNKKNRDELGLFVAEGAKIIQDLIDSGLKPISIFQLHNSLNDNTLKFDIDSVNVSEVEMSKLSNLSTPSDILAIFEQKRGSINDFFDTEFPPIIFLDELQDPGNFGTIIRTADWFGIKHIVCTKNTVDCYNPKVVQSTMGSIARINITYVDIQTFFKKIPSEYDIVGTFMEGNSIYETKFKKQSIIIIGNEGKGISKDVQKFITKQVSIPKQESLHHKTSAESLNASVATSIVCYEFTKQLIYDN